ncbi:MAG: RNA methyltransferase [Candidatus Spechtbacterales bacterium]|nr:RNA methyltransferase [Candidatus Spechtbacterales bacterium]
MKVVLHNIRSMHNVGAIFRTSDAAGIEKIYLCGFTPSPLDEFGKVRVQVHKVALGAEKYVDWEKHDKTYALLDQLKEDGHKIYAVELSDNSIPYYKEKLTKEDKDKAVIVLGHELEGLSPAILKRADKVIEIPMMGKKHSLNVSVAFGVIVYGMLY